MKSLIIASGLIMVLSLSGCTQGSDNVQQRALLTAIQHGEENASSNPTNFTAQSNLLELYAAYFTLLPTNSMSQAETYRQKGLVTAEHALALAPNTYARVFIGMALEKLKEPRRALSIYKEYLAEGDKAGAEYTRNAPVDQRLRPELQTEVEQLRVEIKRRVREIEGQ